MKIEIDIDDKYQDTEVVIRANKLDSDVERLIAMMRVVNMQIGVRQNDETFLLFGINLGKFFCPLLIPRRFCISRLLTGERLYTRRMKLTNRI